MNCPHCQDTRMETINRSGVEIDRCPKCRGVWLDRGELDKLIENAEAAAALEHVEASPDAETDTTEDPLARHGWTADRNRRRSWLGEIFDF